MTARILSDAQIDEMCALRESGWTATRIAQHFTEKGTRISAGAINWQCMAHGADAPVPLQRRARQPHAPFSRGGTTLVKPYTPEEDATLRALRAEGMTMSDIARRSGRHASAVRGRLLTLARRDARAEEDAAQLEAAD